MNNYYGIAYGKKYEVFNEIKSFKFENKIFQKYNKSIFK